MKLSDLLKHDTMASIKEGDQMTVPNTASVDSSNMCAKEEKLIRWQAALDRYKEEANAPMITKMQNKVDKLTREIKEPTTERQMLNPFL